MTLDGITPPIWRQLLLPAGFTLEEVHVVINEAMGWFDSHLHMFIAGKHCSVPEPPITFFAHLRDAKLAPSVILLNTSGCAQRSR